MPLTIYYKTRKPLRGRSAPLRLGGIQNARFKMPHLEAVCTKQAQVGSGLSYRKICLLISGQVS